MPLPYDVASLSGSLDEYRADGGPTSEGFGLILAELDKLNSQQGGALEGLVDLDR